MSDLTNQRHNDDETDSGDVVITDPRLLKRRRSPQRSSSTSSSHIYFSEVDVRKDTLGHIQSVDDISSGYSSGEGLYAGGQVPKISGREGLTRSGSIGSGKARVTRVTRAGVITRRTVIPEVSMLRFFACVFRCNRAITSQFL